MARSIETGVAGKNLCANPKCRKEFPRTRGNQPALCPACREAGVKLPEVAKPSPGKKKAAAKKHPHPPEKKATKPSSDEAEKPECDPPAKPTRSKKESPCYWCTREGCDHRSAAVERCDRMVVAEKLDASEEAVEQAIDALVGAGLVSELVSLRAIEDLLRAWSGGEENAEEFWSSVAAAVWGYLYGRGLAA